MGNALAIGMGSALAIGEGAGTGAMRLERTLAARTAHHHLFCANNGARKTHNLPDSDHGDYAH